VVRVARQIEGEDCWKDKERTKLTFRMGLTGVLRKVFGIANLEPMGDSSAYSTIGNNEKAETHAHPTRSAETLLATRLEMLR
jgi:hypothetical protein